MYDPQSTKPSWEDLREQHRQTGHCDACGPDGEACVVNDPDDEEVRDVRR